MGDNQILWNFVMKPQFNFNFNYIPTYYVVGRQGGTI